MQWKQKFGVKGELMFINGVTKLDIPKKIQYTMLRIPRIKECLVGYNMLFVTIMEPHEAFTSRAMRQPNVWASLPMRAKPPKVERKGWGDNAFKVTPTNL